MFEKINNMFKKLYNYIFYKYRPAKELYIPGYHKVLTHYDDFKEIGKWGLIDEDNNILKEGILYSQTVKFIGNDKNIKLGTDWVDNNIH